MSAPSWFDWKKSTSSPSSAAWTAIASWISSSVSRAVDLGLAGAEQVQVGALEHEHARHAGASTGAAGRPATTPSIASATTASGTSSRTITPSAVGRTQRSRPAACFLSVPVASSTAAGG